jgi:hypothetical protein
LSNDHIQARAALRELDNAANDQKQAKRCLTLQVLLFKAHLNTTPAYQQLDKKHYSSQHT